MISLDVSFDFSHPVGSMRRGQAKVLWTPVPEASVNEDSEATLRERKIRATWKVEMPPPTSDPCLSKEARDEGLGGLVAFPKDASHYPRAFGPGNGIDHVSGASSCRFPRRASPQAPMHRSH